MTTIHTLLFADPDESLWGLYWLPSGAGSASLACRAGATAGVLVAEYRAGDADEPSRLEGDGVSLVFEPSAAGAHGQSGDGAIDSADRLCAVSGTVILDGSQREVNCVGWESRVEGDFALSEVETFRQAYGWFDPADGVGLMALRPRKARGHDADLVAATVLEPEPVPQIDDPRLSSTYDTTGTPIRVGLELWFESDEDETEQADDADRPILRRAAGEAAGERIEWQVDHFALLAVPVHWHSRGRDGSGVYLLGKRE